MAREALGELWEGMGEAPKVEGLNQRTTAEVLLRVGTLTGWIGSTRQIEGAQESAKNLITQSIAIFESIGDLKKVAEAETELGYWREGAMDDARVVLKQAFALALVSGLLSRRSVSRPPPKGPQVPSECTVLRAYVAFP